MLVVFIFALFVFTAIFVIRMLIDLYNSDLEILYKLIWFVAIISFPLIGAGLYYISIKSSK